MLLCLVRLGWPLLLWLAPQAGHAAAPPPSPAPQALAEAPATRLAAAQALGQDGSASALLTLWLLAHDPDHGVVGAALEAALVRCPHEAHAVCLATLSFFMDGEAEETQVAYKARTALLAEQPELARLYASRETKLDVVSLVAGRLSQGVAARPWLAALELLASDPEPEVQEAASAVLLQLER